MLCWNLEGGADLRDLFVAEATAARDDLRTLLLDIDVLLHLHRHLLLQGEEPLPHEEQGPSDEVGPVLSRRLYKGGRASGEEYARFSMVDLGPQFSEYTEPREPFKDVAHLKTVYI